jgi:membrane associated rhomboid family serine protease
MRVTKVVVELAWAAAMLWATVKSWSPHGRGICSSPWAIALSAAISGVIYAVLVGW